MHQNSSTWDLCYMNQVQIEWNVLGKWQVGGSCICNQIRRLCLQLGCAGLLPGILLVPVLMYKSEAMVWREKERARIRAIQMDNFRGLLGIRRINRMLNGWVGEV